MSCCLWLLSSHYNTKWRPLLSEWTFITSLLQIKYNTVQCHLEFLTCSQKHHKRYKAQSLDLRCSGTIRFLWNAGWGGGGEGMVSGGDTFLRPQGHKCCFFLFMDAKSFLVLDTNTNHFLSYTVLFCHMGSQFSADRNRRSLTPMSHLQFGNTLNTVYHILLG